MSGADPNSDIIDFQSEDRSEQHPASEIRPVPKAIKLLIGGIALALVLGAVALYAFNIKTTTQETSTVDMDGDAMVVGGGGDVDGDQAQGVNQVVASLDVARATPSVQHNQNEQISKMQSQIEILTQKINDLMAQENTALEHLSTQVSQNTQVLKTALTQTDLNEIKLDINDIQHKAEVIKAASEKPLKKTRTKKKKYKKRVIRSSQVPFKLITIDQWGGVNYAAIKSREMTGIENLRTGDRLSGWQVETIDAATSTVQFKNVKTGYTIKQTTR